MHERRAAIGSAAFFLVGPGLEAGVAPWLLTRWQRGDGVLAGAAPAMLGALLAVGGLAVVVHAFAIMAREGRGTPSPAAPAERLVVSGAYRHVRNPIYLATAAMIAGQGLLLARPVLLVAAAVYLTALGLFARRWEEPLLRRRFGAAYDAYRAQVPAWIPRLRSTVGADG